MRPVRTLMRSERWRTVMFLSSLTIAGLVFGILFVTQVIAAPRIIGVGLLIGVALMPLSLRQALRLRGPTDDD